MKYSPCAKTEKKRKSVGGEGGGTRCFVVTMATFALLIPAVLLFALGTKKTAVADNKLGAYTNAEKQSDEGSVARRRRLQVEEKEEYDAILPTDNPTVEVDVEEYVLGEYLQMPLKQPVQVEELPFDEMSSYDDENGTIEVVGEEDQGFAIYKVRSDEPLAITSAFHDPYGNATTSNNKVVEVNYIWIKIDGTHPSAGSTVPYIKMYFDSTPKFPVLYLKGRSFGTPFPKGGDLVWDLHRVTDALELVDNDRWDNIIFENPSNDGILINYIGIVHSGESILRWRPNIWLDGDKGNPFRHLGLADKILETKLAMVPNSWIGQLHHAARELGKTNRQKYGSANHRWSNEFANWCLRKNLWGIPNPGPDVYSRQIANWFEKYGRLGKGLYRPYPGDWVQLNKGRSGLFLRFDDAGDIITIEGDVADAVKFNKHAKEDVQATGNTH